jgi:hypothetical protein
MQRETHTLASLLARSLSTQVRTVCPHQVRYAGERPPSERYGGRRLGGTGDSYRAAAGRVSALHHS